MSGREVTYYQQMSFCGKSQCRRCRDGKGHGPYWYSYRTVDGKTTRTYIGKNLPADIQASLQGTHQAQRPPLLTTPAEQSSIRISTLGQFRLERREGAVWQTVNDSAWQQQRVRAVLGYLVSNDKRTMGREQLLDAVWPDVDKETASHRLDRAVYTLRQLFEPAREKLATSPLLLTERDLLILGDQLHIWVDADAFEFLLAQARASTVPNETERILEEAAMLYGGNFLPEERSNEWTLARRGQLQRSWISLLLELADLRIGRDALTLAIEPLDRLLAHDPTSDAAVQRLIRIFAQLGRRGEALRAYKRLAAALYEEYKIAPLPETRALYDAVRRGSNDPLKRQEEKAERVSASTVHEDGTSTSPSHSGTLPRNPAPSLQIGRTHQSPLVGREQELALLRDLLLTTENTAKFTLSGQKKEITASFDTQRRAQSVLLMGEVGIGKTRLAEELGRKARQRGWAVAWSRVYAQEGSIPYRLWIDVLRKALAQHGGIGLSSGLASTRMGQSQEVALAPTLPPQLLQRSPIYQPLATLLPELRSVPSEVAALPPSPPPEQEQLRLWEAVRELLFAISETTPLLIVLDDLQWSDNGSYELLGYLARRLSGQPIVIVGTCRYNELSANSPLRPLLTDLQREHAIEALNLAPLSNEEIRIIVADLLTRTQDIPSHAVPEPTVQHIQTRAAGNPFFAEELARTIAGQPDLADASPTLHATTTDVPPFLPETITAVLDLRLSRLSLACQRLLSRAAVLGGSFEFPIIAAMESGSSGSNEDIVLDLLEEGLRSGMLSEEGIGSRVTYSFWHPLLVNHLYEGLSAARRASLHRRAAEIMLRVYALNESEGAAIIAHHLMRGGAHSDQIAYFAELAGDRAYRLSVYPDAERHYRTVLENMSGHADELQHRAYVLELLGECTRIQGKPEEARHFYEQVLEVRGQKHTFSSLNEQQQEAQVDALLWCEIGQTWYNAGDNAQAQQCYEHGACILREAEVISGPAWARLYHEQSYIHWSEGNYNDARTLAHKSLRLFEEVIKQQHSRPEHASRSTSIRRILAGNPVNLGRAYALLGTIEALAGRSGDAITHFQTALTLFEQYDCQREIAITCCNAGDAYLRKADYSQAQAILRRSLSIAERIGDIPAVTYIFGNLGVLNIRFGNLTEAETELRRSITLAERIDDPIMANILHTYLGAVLQEQGKFSDAKATLSRALAVGRAVHIAPCIGLALVAIGSLRIAQVIVIDVNSEDTSSLHEEKIRILKQAKKSLQHALALEGLETETRIEGQVAQAQVSLLLGEIESALQQALQALEDARLSELTWLVARAQRLLGNTFAVQGEQEQAEKYFEQALRTFRKRSMRLEYGRTLHQYGSVLVQKDGREGKRYAQGMVYLQEARLLFTECRAMLDLRSVERVLTEHEHVKT